MSIWQRSICFIFIHLLLISTVTAQETETSIPEGNIVVVDSAFVRSGPSDDYLAVGALFAGDAVTPVNISEDGLWILIPYSRSNGWIRRSLVRWEDEAELNQLPVLEANITPTPRISITNTPFIPTATPSGNYINLDGAASAYVRAGPGRGYLRLGQLLPGETVEPVSRNEDTTWIMIRYSNDALPDDFAWVAVELVYWEDYLALTELPSINTEDLTPTATYTPSQTPSVTATASTTSTTTITPSNTPEPTLTYTLTATQTPEPTLTNTATHTATNTPEPTLTDVPTNTVTNTPEPTFTLTLTTTPSDTPQPTETETAVPTHTETNTPEPTVTLTATTTRIPSDTPQPTATETDLPTQTNTPEPTHTLTLTATLEPSATITPSQTPPPTTTETELPANTEIQAVVVVASDTVVPSSTSTLTPTPSETAQLTDIFALQSTSVAVEATTSALDIDSTQSEIIEETASEGNSQAIPLETIVGIGLLLLVLSYIWFYWQGLSAIGRYDNRFVIEDCPVCHRGKLTIDAKQSRMFGIPTVKRTIRCDECRSILRETGTKRWRYAVDRIENPTLFDRFNGRELSDADLERLVKNSPKPATPRTSPEFVDDNVTD